MQTKDQPATYVLTRHDIGPEQQLDIERICREKRANLPIQIKDWHNSLFKSPTLAHGIIPEGSLVFMVGTIRHYKNAKDCGYRVFIPYFAKRNTGFSHHTEFIKGELVEVPA